MPVIIDKLLDILLDPAIPDAVKGTLQENLYIRHLKSKKLTYHRLQQNLETQKYEIINLDDQIVPYHKTAHIYSFVIIQNTVGDLELRLGLGNHYFTAGCAPSVKAAGDIHFWKGDITKITDQSGGYHTNAPECLHSACDAMAIVGLPMDKFQAFSTEPMLFTGNKRPLLTPLLHAAAGYHSQIAHVRP